MFFETWEKLVLFLTSLFFSRGIGPVDARWAFWCNQTKLHGFNIKLYCIINLWEWMLIWSLLWPQPQWHEPIDGLWKTKIHLLINSLWCLFFYECVYAIQYRSYISTYFLWYDVQCIFIKMIYLQTFCRKDYWKHYCDF